MVTGLKILINLSRLSSFSLEGEGRVPKEPDLKPLTPVRCAHSPSPLKEERVTKRFPSLGGVADRPGGPTFPDSKTFSLEGKRRVIRDEGELKPLTPVHFVHRPSPLKEERVRSNPSPLFASLTGPLP